MFCFRLPPKSTDQKKNETVTHLGFRKSQRQGQIESLAYREVSRAFEFVLQGHQLFVGECGARTSWLAPLVVHHRDGSFLLDRRRISTIGTIVKVITVTGQDDGRLAGQ